VCLEISVWKSENHVFWSFCQLTLRRGILAPRCADLGSILSVYAQAWEAGAARATSYRFYGKICFLKDIWLGFGFIF
jgi:hypothetical protein